MIVNDHSTDSLVFLQLHLGGDRNFHYLVADARTGEAAAVDPGFDAAGFGAIVAEKGLRLTEILITHGHPDHNGAAAELAAATGAVVRAGDPAFMDGARILVDDELVHVGGVIVRALTTPGHAPDHFCFLCQDRLITGDLLFCGKVGGTGSYFPGSDARQEWDSLQRVLALPSETSVYPGHDYYGGQGTMTSSTIGHESAHNPFLNGGDFGVFCHLKENWAAYKKEHGIR